MDLLQYTATLMGSREQWADRHLATVTQKGAGECFLWVGQDKGGMGRHNSMCALSFIFLTISTSLDELFVNSPSFLVLLQLLFKMAAIFRAM